MTPDEKRRLYILKDRDRHMDATTLMFWAAIGLSLWAFLAVLIWAANKLITSIFGAAIATEAVLIWTANKLIGFIFGGLN